MVSHVDFSFLAAEFSSALRFVAEVEVSGYWITLSGLAYLEVPLQNSLLAVACLQVTNLAIIM